MRVPKEVALGDFWSFVGESAGFALSIGSEEVLWERGLLSLVDSNSFYKRVMTVVTVITNNSIKS